MQALSQENLAGNAFRVLGLPAGAGQAQIDAAARRMRIWTNPAQIPPTPWDLPWLGSLPRSRSDIELAVARLTDPVSRINQRLFWFAENGAAQTAQPRGRIFGRILKPAPIAASAAHPACSEHDAALARLASALIADPQTQSPQRWSGALAAFCESAASLDYREWFVAAEGAGEFEKKAGVEEVLALMNALPGSIAQSLATRARDALDHDRAGACIQLIWLLRAAGPDERLRSKLEAGIGDRIEDLLTARCKGFQNDLFKNIRWENSSAAAAVRVNRATCRRAAKEVRHSIDPLFTALAEFETFEMASGITPERMKRVGPPAAGMLRNLGLGWGRVGQRKKAEQAFRRALRLTSDREMAGKLNADLANLKKTKATRPGRVAIVLVVMAALRGFSTLMSDSSSSKTDTSQLPNLRELEHEREMRERVLQLSVPPAMTPPQGDSSWERFLHSPAGRTPADLRARVRPTTFPFDDLFPEIGGAARPPSTEP